MIQSLFIMSKTGEVMIEKHWRGTTPRNVCDFFWDEVNRHDVPEAVPPILQVWQNKPRADQSLVWIALERKISDCRLTSF